MSEKSAHKSDGIIGELFLSFFQINSSVPKNVTKEEILDDFYVWTILELDTVQI
jgi:hypothetical protein